MITERDRIILEYLREYKFITLEQLRKMFFKDTKQGYNIARRRMGVLIDLGYIRSDKSKFNKKNIYRINNNIEKVNMPSEIEIITMDVLAELKYLDFNVKEFIIQKNEKVNFGTGFAKIQYLNVTLNVIIDVQLINSKHNLELFNYNEAVNLCGTDFKHEKNLVLIVSDKKYYDLYDINEFYVRQISTQLIGLKDIISTL